MSGKNKLLISKEKIAEFCKKNRIRKFSLFGQRFGMILVMIVMWIYWLNLSLKYG